MNEDIWNWITHNIWSEKFQKISDSHIVKMKKSQTFVKNVKSFFLENCLYDLLNYWMVSRVAIQLQFQATVQETQITILLNQFKYWFCMTY